MAKGYIVRRAFQSRSLDLWICPDTADQVGKMSTTELNHALRTGAVEEVDFPPGVRHAYEVNATPTATTPDAAKAEAPDAPEPARSTSTRKAAEGSR